jgi:hypothetical protein
MPELADLDALTQFMFSLGSLHAALASLAHCESEGDQLAIAGWRRERLEYIEGQVEILERLAGQGIDGLVHQALEKPPKSWTVGAILLARKALAHARSINDPQWDQISTESEYRQIRQTLHDIAFKFKEARAVRQTRGASVQVADGAQDGRADAVFEKLNSMIGDASSVEIAEIVNRADLSGNDKFEKIIRIDQRMAGKSSDDVASLLGCTSANVRQMAVWKRLQQAKRVDS